jgi:acetyltransferase
MSTYRLDKLFEPASVAVVGASSRAGSLGGIVLCGLQQGGYKGALHAINPKHDRVLGINCHASLGNLAIAPDLVIVTTPAHAVSEVIADAARIGAQTAIVLTAGLGHGPGSIADDIRLCARKAGLRLIGPNCLGVLAPRASLNASFAKQLPMKGHVALVSQSGAIAAGVVEWAIQRSVGFSGVVSLGDAVDVDFGDCLDYFAEDISTKVIVLYVEAITNARKFMSAARKAARVKPVIVIKAGRHEQGAKAAATHTGALAGSDQIYDAALQCAGCLRVLELDDLFTVIDTLAVQMPFAGNRLAILTNGGGLGVLAVDRLEDVGGTLAAISGDTLALLDAVLPATWSRANPVDIIGDAPAERYTQAMNMLMADDANDAILVMNCPTALTSAREAADAVVAATKAMRSSGARAKPVFAVWLGSGPEQKQLFKDAGIASYDTEDAAISGITQLMRIHHAQAALLDIPPSLSESISPQRDKARIAIGSAVADAREWLNPVEASELLAAYAINAVPVRLASDGDHAASAAQGFLAMGDTCVVKIQSRDIVHKSDVDGVRLGLASAEAVQQAADDVLARARALKPDARIDGVTIQPMILRPNARELIIGVAVDPTFGPVILFGHGGTAVEVIDDKAMALLPLDLAQARALIAGTRVSRLLRGYRNIAAADAETVADMLVRVSRLIEDHGAIVGIDLNPVLCDENGAVVIDARLQIRRVGEGAAARTDFAIRPYPRELEAMARLPDGSQLAIRPLRPTDAQAVSEMLARCSADDLQMRFFASIRSVDKVLITRLTQLDYAREMAFVAVDPASHELLGVARLHGDSNHSEAEYAIIIRSDRQGRGLGHDMMLRLINFAKAEGYTTITGQVLAQNDRMLAMCRKLGFEVRRGETGDDTLMVRLSLDHAPTPAHEGGMPAAR